MISRSLHLRFGKYVFSDAKRLLQQYRHKCEVPAASGNVRVRGPSGRHVLIVSSSDFDPTRSPSVHRSSGKNHCRAAPAVTPSMCLLSRCSGLAISWILTVILFLEHCLTSFLLPQLASSPFWIAVVKFVPTSKITIYCVSSSR